jgi:hypothetical protein
MSPDNVQRWQDRQESLAREGTKLVPCADCYGNVRRKVKRGQLPDGQSPPGNFTFRGSSITVVESVYYAAAGEQPHVVENHFARRLTSAEQLYVRKTTVAEGWQPLDAGWVRLAAMIVLTNEEGRRSQVQPTSEEKAMTAVRVVEIGVLGPDRVEAFALVLPGESCRFQPADTRTLRVCCRQGQARITIAAFPS